MVIYCFLALFPWLTWGVALSIGNPKNPIDQESSTRWVYFNRNAAKCHYLFFCVFTRPGPRSAMAAVRVKNPESVSRVS